MVQVNDTQSIEHDQMKVGNLRTRNDNGSLRNRGKANLHGLHRPLLWSMVVNIMGMAKISACPRYVNESRICAVSRHKRGGFQGMMSPNLGSSVDVRYRTHSPRLCSGRD